VGSKRTTSPGQTLMGLVQPVLRTDGYCGSCNVNVRDIFIHRASEAHKAGHYRRSLRGLAGGMPSARKTAMAASFRSLRDYDSQYAEDDPGNSASWDAEQAQA